MGALTNNLQTLYRKRITETGTSVGSPALSLAAKPVQLKSRLSRP